MVSDEDSTASDPTVLDLTAHFAEVTDPRIDRCKQHTLLDIIGLTICAVIAGADTFTAIERFGRARRAWLEQFLELEGEIGRAHV